MASLAPIIPPEERLAAHYKAQETLAAELGERFDKMEAEYAKDSQFAALKLRLATKLTADIDALPKDKKLAVLLVDIQNDFCMDGAALYAGGGENTVLTNMALLDAIATLSDEQRAKIDIITSQDAHRLGRDMTHPEAQMMKLAYDSEAAALAAVDEEQRELEPINPPEGKFGLHCIAGTIGAAIVQPIEARLRSLKRDLGVSVTRFAKINFSGPKAGMLLADEATDLSDPKWREDGVSIYSEAKTAYNDFFKDQGYHKVEITGICGDVCVQQAAEGLREALPAETSIEVNDACQHFLVIEAIGKDYDSTRKAVQDSYAEKGIDMVSLGSYRSNPDCKSTIYPMPAEGVAASLAAHSILHHSADDEAAVKEKPHSGPAGPGGAGGGSTN